MKKYWWSPKIGPHQLLYIYIYYQQFCILKRILASVAVPQYQLAVAKARYTEVIELAEALYKAEEIYYLANGTYTNNKSELDLEIPTSSKVHVYPNVSSEDSNVVGYHVKTPDLMYLIYLDHHAKPEWRGVRHCRVLSDNEMYKKLCQNLTGKPISGESGYWNAKF